MTFRNIMIMSAAATLSVVAPAAAQPDAGTFEQRLDAYIETQMREQKVPGLAVAVLRGDEVIVAKGYGRATVEHDVRVTPDTIFQSGSVGKMFTATAIMTLVEQGQLGLDDRISKFLPDAPATWQCITFRQLLTHTSGIPDFDEAFDLRRDYSDEDLVKHAYALTLDFQPGARWSYSNTGYMLLGILAKKVSGKSYLEVLDSRVFKPLGMTTARGISDADIVPNRAAGYQLADGKLRNQDWVSPTMNSTADGALYLSLTDMIAWSRGLDRGAILSPAGWKQVFAPAKLTSGKTYPYGFGWEIGEAGGQPIYHHGGGWQGFRANYARYPEDGIAIILFANLVQTRVDKLNDGVARLWKPELVAERPRPRPVAEPAITKRVTALVEAARAGKLTKQDMPIARAGFVEAVNQYFPRLLLGYGPLKALDLVDRRERGDDMIYIFSALLGDRRVKVVFGRAPDGQGSQFMISEEGGT